MPYTPAQRRLFHEIAENPDAARRHGVSRKEGQRLASEADKLAREGREKPEKTEKKDSNLGILPEMRACGGQTQLQRGQKAIQATVPAQNSAPRAAAPGHIDLSRVFGRR